VSSLRANTFANLLGQIWRALMAFAFVPVLIQQLGTEAFGLIALYASLQAWFVLVDMGLRPTVSREMATLKSGRRSAESAHDLLRTIELVAISFSLFAALGLFLASTWLASHWLNTEKLSLVTTTNAIVVMGVIAAAQLMEGLYAGALAGLERQVLQNVVASAMATLRGLGGAICVSFVAADIGVYFAWQLGVAVLAVFSMRLAVKLAMPSAARAARLSWAELHGVRAYAGGVVVITILVLMLTQVDKILLATLLPLDQFAHYALAGLVASSMFYLYGPVVSAFYPRLTVYAGMPNKGPELARTYHLGSQLVTVLAGTVAITLVAFSEPLLRMWTGNADMAREVAPLLVLLTIGTLLNGLMALPYHLQLAHGWTSLTIALNSFAVVVLGTAILILVPKFGATASAAIYACLNAMYVLVGVWLMHKRLLPLEKWRWYLRDTAIPLLVMASVGFATRGLVNEEMPPFTMLLCIALSASAVLASAIIAAPEVRSAFTARMFRSKQITNANIL